MEGLTKDEYIFSAICDMALRIETKLGYIQKDIKDIQSSLKKEKPPIT